MQLRKLDRIRHAENYPALFFPCLYLLQGGFCSLFESHPELCVNGSIYRTMMSPAYVDEMWTCERLRKRCNTSAVGCTPETNSRFKLKSPCQWGDRGHTSRRFLKFLLAGDGPSTLSLESIPIVVENKISPRVKRKSIVLHEVQYWHSKSLLDDISELV